MIGKEKFKGVLFYSKKSNEECYIIEDGKIKGTGVWMHSSGQVFKVKFASHAQRKYADKTIYKYHNCMGVLGYNKDGVIYVKGLYHPKTKSSQAKTLHRVRESKKLSEYDNVVMEGKHRSHETYVPSGVKSLAINYKKTEKKENKPKQQKTTSRQASQVDDFELEKKLEKRRNDYDSFAEVAKWLKKDALRMAMTDGGMSYDEIETVIQGIRICRAYMNYRSK